jgi:hypothetical protein
MKSIYSEVRPIEKFRTRKSVVKRFYEWAEREIQKLCIEAARRNLGPFWTTNPMSRMKKDFEAELDRALRSAVRNYGSSEEKEAMNFPLFKPR